MNDAGRGTSAAHGDLSLAARRRRAVGLAPAFPARWEAAPLPAARTPTRSGAGETPGGGDGSKEPGWLAVAALAITMIIIVIIIIIIFIIIFIMIFIMTIITMITMIIVIVTAV